MRAYFQSNPTQGHPEVMLLYTIIPFSLTTYKEATLSFASTPSLLPCNNRCFQVCILPQKYRYLIRIWNQLSTTAVRSITKSAFRDAALPDQSATSFNLGQANQHGLLVPASTGSKIKHLYIVHPWFQSLLFVVFRGESSFCTTSLSLITLHQSPYPSLAPRCAF